MNLISKNSLIKRLRRGRSVRHRFVESHLAAGIAHQIRAIRDRLGWSQERLADEVGMNQNAISRLESPEYGRPTLTTLKRIAAAFDVGLIVRFVPFSEMADWVSGTPRVDHGLSAQVLAVPNFAAEESDALNASAAPALDQFLAGLSAGIDLNVTHHTIAPGVNQKPERAEVIDFAARKAAMNTSPDSRASRLRAAAKKGTEQMPLKELYG